MAQPRFDISYRGTVLAVDIIDISYLKRNTLSLLLFFILFNEHY